MAGDGRVHITFRLAERGRDWLDDVAHTHHTDRSTVIRAALAVARERAPEVISKVKQWKEGR